MNDKKKIHYLNEKYYKYLIQNNLSEIHKKTDGPYIGFIKINLSKYDYIIPLTFNSHKYKHLHKYSFPILINNETQGTLLINKMLPVLNNINFLKEIDEELLSPIRKKELDYLNKSEIIKQITLLANEAWKMKDPNLKFNINFNHAEQLCEKYISLTKGNKLKVSQEQVDKKQHFNIYLPKKNVKQENNKKYSVLIPTMGLINIPKETISSFEAWNKNTGKMCSITKVSFALENNYIMFQKKQGNIQETFLKGEELFNKFKGKELSKELNVGLKLIPKITKTNDSKLERKKEKGMEI